VGLHFLDVWLDAALPRLRLTVRHISHHATTTRLPRRRGYFPAFWTFGLFHPDGTALLQPSHVYNYCLSQLRYLYPIYAVVVVVTARTGCGRQTLPVPFWTFHHPLHERTQTHHRWFCWTVSSLR